MAKFLSQEAKSSEWYDRDVLDALLTKAQIMAETKDQAQFGQPIV